jgi:hypothetical protein
MVKSMDEVCPKVIGEDLLKNIIEIPHDLHGGRNILIVAFKQWHQKIVNTWVPFLEDLVGKMSDLEFYEIPTIRRMNFLYRSIINGGMRAGIPSHETRGRTITLYIDKKPFRKALDIADEDDVHIFLIEREGKILWSAMGAFTPEKGTSLVEALHDSRI